MRSQSNRLVNRILGISGVKQCVSSGHIQQQVDSFYGFLVQASDRYTGDLSRNLLLHVACIDFGRLLTVGRYAGMKIANHFVPVCKCASPFLPVLLAPSGRETALGVLSSGCALE